MFNEYITKKEQKKSYYCVFNCFIIKKEVILGLELEIGTWNWNQEQELGIETWNQNLELELGNRTWNWDFEAEFRSGTWNRSLELELVI